MNQTNQQPKAVSEQIGKNIRYFKITQNDKVFVGKQYNGRIPKNAYPITFKEYMEIRFGKEVVQRFKRTINKVSDMATGELIIENFQVPQNTAITLPNPNDEEAFKKIIKTTESITKWN